MLESMFKALKERLKVVDGTVPKDSASATDFVQAGVDFDLAIEERWGPNFYMATAVPLAAVLADQIGDAKIVCAELKKYKRGKCEVITGLSVRLWTMGGRIGRFDILYKEAPAGS